MTGFTITQQTESLLIAGDLTRHTINKKNATAITPYLRGNNVIIDLSQVNKIDTAGLAWLLFIVESYQSADNTLSFHHVNEKLIKLSQLSGVESFLPIVS